MSDTVKVRELWYINKEHFLNRAIAAATWPPNMGTVGTSHCSLWEPDHEEPGNSFVRVNGAGSWYWGQCWTSTTRKVKGDPDDIAGTKVRPAATVLIHPENWLYTEHQVLRYKFEYAKARAQVRVDNNKGYAYTELLRYTMPFWLFKRTPFYDPAREKCSPHVEQWLFDMGVLRNIRLRSPRRLCKHVVLATGSPLRRLVDDVIVRDGEWKKKNGIYRKAA